MPRSYRDGQALVLGTCSCCPTPKDKTMPEPEPYCEHGPFDACRCLASDPGLKAAAQRVYEAQRAEDRMNSRE
jgi:hypothetical protein